jgi:phage shock protein A
VTALLREEETYSAQARSALEQADESAAREFLVKKREKQAKRIEQEEKSNGLSKKITMLEQSYEAMREKVKDFMEQRDELEADLSAAKAQLWMTNAADLMDKAKNDGLEALAQETRVAQAQVSLHQTFDEEFEAFVRSVKND